MLGCCADKKYGKGCTADTCMQLPEGKTCGDCVFSRRCIAMFGKKREHTTCDFFPRQFHLAVVPGT